MVVTKNWGCYLYLVVGANDVKCLKNRESCTKKKKVLPCLILSVIPVLGSMEGDSTEFPECQGSRYPLNPQRREARHGFPFGTFLITKPN